jgi:integrase
MLHLRPNSADTYLSHLRNHIYPLLGDRRMGTITRSDVQAFVSAVSGKVAPSTTETVYAVLRAMMQHAVDDDPQVIPANPCTRIKLPKSRKRVVEPLPATAVLVLLNAITPRYRVAVALGVGLGLREGEAFGLTVPRVDFMRRKVQVLSQAQRGQLAADLKTQASTRTIPADEWVLSEISAHVQRFGTGPGEVIVTNRLGKVARRNSFGDRWRLAVADARICGNRPAQALEGGQCGETCADPAHCLPKGTRFHDLRHFYASTLIAANLNPKVIQARLGHATIAETMDTYGHLFPDAEDLGRGAIDAIFAMPLTEQGRNQESR